MDPLTANAFVLIVVLVAFFVIGSLSFDPKADLGKFFLINRELSSGSYARSFTASSTSLATVLFFFVQFGGSHGLYILFAPLTYFLGAWAYTALLKGLTRDHFTETGTTLADYVGKKYESEAIAWVIRVTTFVGLLSILLIEFYVGITIIKIYAGTLAELVGLTGIAVLVAGYTTLGGFLGVLRTDRIQFWLMATATVFLFGWLYFAASSLDLKVQWFPYPALQSSGPLLPWSLLLNIMAVNAFLIPTHLRTWQMAAASRSIGEVKRGILLGGIQTVLLWTGFALIGIFFVVVQPGTETTVFNLLLLLESSSSWFLQYVLFPLLFCGCVSAMVSTADSAMLPLLYEIVYPLTARSSPAGANGPQSQSNRPKEDAMPVYAWRLYLGVLGILVIVLLGYHLVIKTLGYDFNSLLFTLFSLLIVAGPTLVVGILWPLFARSRAGKISALVSVVGGIILALAVSYSGVLQRDLGLVQYGGPLSVAWAVSAMVVGRLFHRPRSEQTCQ